jgi:hypothetical protein
MNLRLSLKMVIMKEEINMNFKKYQKGIYKKMIKTLPLIYNLKVIGKINLLLIIIIKSAQFFELYHFIILFNSIIIK